MLYRINKFQPLSGIMIIILIYLMEGLVSCNYQKAEQETSSENIIQPFLPEVMKKFPNVRDLAISPDGKEIYFSVDSYKKDFSFIATMNLTGDGLSLPSIADFSGRYKELEPNFSPDGLRLYYASKRPLIDGDSTEKEDYDIWYVKRDDIDSKWSDPINVGSPVNTEGNEFYPSIVSSGNLYFTAERDDSNGREDIYMSVFENNVFTEPTTLDTTINTKYYEFNAYVSPDESLIVFSSFGRNDGLGGGDLYFSSKDVNNNWKMAINMGADINSSQLDYCPFIDYLNGKFYYSSERNTVNYNNCKSKSIDEILLKMNKFGNGMSRIYWLDLSKTSLPYD